MNAHALGVWCGKTLDAVKHNVTATREVTSLIYYLAGERTRIFDKIFAHPLKKICTIVVCWNSVLFSDDHSFAKN
jgi:hypothetical protein